MKQLKLLLLAATLLLANSCGGDIIEIIVQNSGDEPLKNTIVTIDYKALQKKFPGIQITPEFSLADEKGSILPTQFDDINGDQKWDEIAILTDFAPKQTRIFRFKKTPDSLISFDQTARLWLKLNESTVRPMLVDEVYGKNLETEKRYAGITWQNSDNFFRIRFYPQNTIDLLPLQDSTFAAFANRDSILGKLIMPWPAEPQTPNLGGFVLSENGKIFPANQLFGFQARVLSRGPVRTVLRIDYEDWPTNTLVTKVAWLLMSYHQMPVVEHRFYLKPQTVAKVPIIAIEKPSATASIDSTDFPIVYSFVSDKKQFFTLVFSPENFLKNDNAPHFLFLQPNLQAIPALRYFTILNSDSARLSNYARHLRSNISNPLIIEF